MFISMEGLIKIEFLTLADLHKENLIMLSPGITHLVDRWSKKKGERAKVLDLAFLVSVAFSPFAIMNTIIPIDILREIASHVNPGPDILNLSLTSKRIHDHIYPILFRDIELRNNHARQIVQYLLLRPKVARTVQSLVLRPSFLQMCSKRLLARERDLARDVEFLAPNLYNLRKFVWDGIEIPASSVWASLKLGCPHLSEIGTNLGSEPVNPESELFRFSDLTGFSLTSELHYDTLPNFDPSVVHGEELPPALWTMLIERSPRLQTLVLGDDGATMHNQCRINVRPLLHARWPYLRSLSITRACIDDLRDNPFDLDTHNKKQFATFIEAHHDTLRHVSYHKFVGELHKDYRDPPLLEYKGRDPHPRMRVLLPSLQEISLTGIKFYGAFLPALKQQLSGQRELRKLEIWMDFSEHVQQLDPQEQDCIPKKPMAYDQITELKELFMSCPRGLESLKLILTTNEKETIYWRDIPQILPRNTQNHDRKYQLKHLEVWKAPKSKEYGLKDAAIQIALAETYSTSDSGLSSSTVIPPSIEFAAPGLETIVLVGCLCTAKARFRYERMRVLFHGKYRVHRQTISDEYSDWPFVDNTRGIMPSLAAFTGKTQAPTQVKTVPQAFVTLTANERGAESKPTWVIPHYRIQLGALTGASKSMMKGKKVLVVNSPSQREWYMLDEPNVIRQTWGTMSRLCGLYWMWIGDAVEKVGVHSLVSEISSIALVVTGWMIFFNAREALEILCFLFASFVFRLYFRPNIFGPPTNIRGSRRGLRVVEPALTYIGNKDTVE
ncbi:hypothetical protein BT96DRAFT_978766 [Gymnopus androsaceus JB14]|uniref:F-box domain-containing protein n=1 Tax=Gymnopus androsaceus JB14 TaxID=1447944 RepID=A0A6A4H750_9AGAR|nr:hypothetical protein BT96DRAFT_978766 [Gymnopus androsaceus JB14]